MNLKAVASNDNTHAYPDIFREAVCVFDNEDDFIAAIDELEIAGFNRARISLLASERTVEEKLHRHYRRVDTLEDNPNAPREAFVSIESRSEAEGALVAGLMYVGAVSAAGAVVASGGMLAGAIGAAILAGSAGGLLGTFLATFIEQKHAEYIQEQLEKGGLLLWVSVNSEKEEKLATFVMHKHSGKDVHIHELPLGKKTRKAL